MKKSFPQWLTSHKLKNLSMKAIVSAGMFMMIGIAANSQTNYYVRLDSVKSAKAVKATLSKPQFWTTDPLGTITAPGATQPVDFTTAGQIFNVQTTGYTNGAVWTISGAGSKLVVGTKDSIVLLTSSGNLTATIDLFAGSSLTLTCPNTDGVSFENIGAGTTVRYSGNANGSQKVAPANYVNLNLAAAAGSLPIILPSSPIGVSGTLTNNNKIANLNGSTFVINGKGGQLVNATNFYNLTFSGTRTTPDTLRGTVAIAGTLTNNTGTPFVVGTANATTGVMAYSTVSYNGHIPQVSDLPTYGNLTFSNGQNFYVSSFDNAAKTITLAASAQADLKVGAKIAANALTTPISLDTSTVITAITDSVLTLSNAPLLRAYVNRLGHAAGAKPDSIFIASFTPLPDSVVTIGVGSVAVGDTLVSQILAAKSAAIAVNSTTNAVTLSTSSTTKVLTNVHNFLAVNFGLPNRLPSDKTIPSDVTILGNLTANNAIASALGTTTYKGKKQTVGGITYNNLVINQDSAFTATLGGKALVQGAFTLASGKLSTSNNNLLTLDVNATFPAVTNDTFYVNGPLAKKFASTSPFKYQIGTVVANVGRARSVVITPATADAKTYAASYTWGKVANATKLDSVGVFSLDTTSYYTIAGTNYTGDSTAKISLQYNFGAPIDNSLVLAHYVGTKFISEGNVHVPSSETAGSITTDNFIGTFGRFAFGYNPALLPVKLSDVIASTVGSTVKVSWKSLSETNVTSYVVEGSADGVTFTAKGTVLAKGASDYSFVDVAPLAGANYYRIKEVDNNGASSYSAVVSVKSSALSTNLAIYPNPVVNKLLKFSLNTNAANYSLKVTNILGQSFVSRTISHNGGTASYNVSLPSNVKAGTYFVKLSDGVKEITKTIVVE